MRPQARADAIHLDVLFPRAATNNWFLPSNPKWSNRPCTPGVAIASVKTSAGEAPKPSLLAREAQNNAKHQQDRNVERAK